MINFVKYISPSWYFNLKPDTDAPYFPDIEKIPFDTPLDYIAQTENYSSHAAQKIDYAYQLWLKGYIVQDSSLKLQFTETDYTLFDCYLFIKRFYHPAWVIIVFLFRVVGLKNPIKEFSALIHCLKYPRIQATQKHFSNDLNTQEYSLLKQNPKVSVIIPTLNRYKYLKNVLEDLEKQDYPNIEVLIADQSDLFDPEFYKGWKLDLTVWNQKEKALWLARNTAIQKASGNYILLYDDDSLVDESWVTNHLNCIDFFGCEISSGVSISVVGGKVPLHYSYFRWSDQIDTGNVMIKRNVFEKVGLFDRQFEKQRQGDGEFGLRAYLFGFKNISNPLAKRIHLKVSEGGLREMGSWDGWRPKNIFAPRPIPSVLYLTRKYFGNIAAVREIAISGTLSIVPYRYKGSNKKMILGGLIGLLMLPVILISFMRSWRLSTKKLKEGAIIPQLQPTNS